jgi:hypothetical protein
MSGGVRRSEHPALWRRRVQRFPSGVQPQGICRRHGFRAPSAGPLGDSSGPVLGAGGDSRHSGPRVWGREHHREGRGRGKWNPAPRGTAPVPAPARFRCRVQGAGHARRARPPGEWCDVLALELQTQDAGADEPPAQPSSASQHAPGSVGSPCGPLRCFRRGEARRDAPTRAGHGDRCA